MYNSSVPTLHIVRGLPGSGKTTYSRDKLKFVPKVEADDFFYELVDGEIVYNFDASKLHIAHKNCFEKTVNILEQGSDVVVSNTFTTRKELLKYLKIADSLNIDIVIHEIKTQFKSVHNVPEYAMERMRNRWYNIEDEIIEKYHLEVKAIKSTTPT